MNDTSTIFLSYAREDRARVEQVYDALRAEGFEPWMDTRNLVPGEKWSSAIDRRIRATDYILVFLSHNAISKRGFFHREIRAALSVLAERPEGNVFLIPVRLDESPVPEALSSIQFVDLFEPQGQGWHSLLRSLRQGRDAERKTDGGIHDLREEIRKEDRAQNAETGPYVFVAMPFQVEMEDIYHYGIRTAVTANGFRCERIDKTSFTGDILERTKARIQGAVAVVADLTGGNANVHLELGYAWA